MKALCVFAVLAAVMTPAFASNGGPMTPTEALGYPGIAVTVQGPAMLRHPTANYGGQDAMLVALGMGGNKAVVLGYIRNGDIGNFPDLDSLNGGIVNVSGTMEMNNGQAEIRLETPDQIAIVR